MGSRRDRLTAETAAIRAVLANRDIARLQLGWLAANATTYAFLVVTLVVAYDAGGAFTAGLLGVVRFLPPTLVAPFAGLPAARWRADRVLLIVSVIRMAAIGLTAVILLAGWPIWLLFVVVATEATFSGLTRPLHMSLLPWLARTPGELVASNIASSAAEALGTLVGPAIAGILLAASSAVGATAATTVMIAVTVLAVASVRVPTMRSRRPAQPFNRSATAGLRAFVRYPAVRFTLIGLGLQVMVRGMLTVLLVVTAIERLGMGEPGVGTLNAAIGAGGFLGAIAALSLTRRSRFADTYAIALSMWGLPIAALGILTDPLLAVGMLAIVGMSNAILDVAGFTLIQRGTPNDERVAVMGLIDGLAAGMSAIGGLLASGLLALVGLPTALLLSGALLPVSAVAILASLRRAEARLDSHEAEAQVLRADPLLRLLSLSVVEELAAVIRPVRFEDGEILMREGDPGDQYVIIADGEVVVSQAGHPMHRVGAGRGVGEIALLRKVPRTATVTATGPVEGYSLDCDAFLSAVTGHVGARAAADEIIDDHLARSSASPSL